MFDFIDTFKAIEIQYNLIVRFVCWRNVGLLLVQTVSIVNVDSYYGPGWKYQWLKQ